MVVERGDLPIGKEIAEDLDAAFKKAFRDHRPVDYDWSPPTVTNPFEFASDIKAEEKELVLCFLSNVCGRKSIRPFEEEVDYVSNVLNNWKDDFKDSGLFWRRKHKEFVQNVDFTTLIVCAREKREELERGLTEMSAIDRPYASVRSEAERWSWICNILEVGIAIESSGET